MSTPIEIVQGEDKTIRLTLTNNGRAYDLSSLTAAEVRFPGSISKTLGSGVTVVSPSSSGLLDVVLTDTETQAMPEGASLGIEVVLDFGAVRKIKQPTAAISVYRRGFRKA